MTARPLQRGSRVHLRHPATGDRDGFLERVRASRRLHRPWAWPPDTAEAFETFLDRAGDPTSETLLVCLNDGKELAGVFNLSQIVRGPFCSAYLGYYAFVPFAGRGYMREGLPLTLRHAFGALGLHRVEANIQPGNQASIALARGAGFRLEGFSPRYLKIGGRWRDHERWAILAEDLRTT